MFRGIYCYSKMSFEKILLNLENYRFKIINIKKLFISTQFTKQGQVQVMHRPLGLAMLS